MPSSATRRAMPLLIIALGALLAGGLAAAPPVQAGTLYACVKRDGTAHLYAKRPKCRRHERRLVWNTQGPAGTNGSGGASGSNGADGKPGANGAVAGFSAEGTEGVSLFGESTKQVPGMSIGLPPGSFIASMSIGVSASAESAGAAGVTCSLADTPEGAFTRYNQGEWYAPLPASRPHAVGQISIHMAFSSAKPSTLSVSCAGFGAEGTNVSLGTGFGVMIAVQTTMNS